MWAGIKNVFFYLEVECVLLYSSVNNEFTYIEVYRMCFFVTRLVTCGQNHTLVLLQDDAVVGWGDNSHGQV